MEHDPTISGLLVAGIAQCQSVATDNATTLFALFVAGLAGSASHCAGMCGPFVLSQVAVRLEGVPASQMHEMHRLRGAMVLPYHLGRLTTYMGLGALASYLSGGIIDLANLSWLAALLLVIAAIFFAAYALQRLGIALPRSPSEFTAPGEGMLRRLLERTARPLFARPTGWRGYGLGMLLGFLPCGLLYGALAAASAPGDWLAGIFAMGAFGLGTIPALFAIGIAGHIAAGRWRQITHWLAPVVLLANAGVLAFMAWRLM